MEPQCSPHDIGSIGEVLRTRTAMADPEAGTKPTFWRYRHKQPATGMRSWCSPQCRRPYQRGEQDVVVREQPWLPQSSRARASELPTKDTMSDNNRDFQTALNKLRRDTIQTQFGLAILNNLGPDLIMGDSILERITQCARAHKLGTLEDLYRETKWDQTWELGKEVLQLVRQ